MNVRTTDLNQSATYWAPAGNDGFGGRSYSAPVLIACRWQFKSDLVRTADGKEVTSSIIAYVDRHLETEGYLVLGDYTGEVSPVGTGYQILAFGSSPDLAASEELLKVWL